MVSLNPQLSVAIEPAAEPLTLAQARLFLKVDTDVTEDDDLISRLVTAARKAGELETGRSWITQTLRLTLDMWPEAKEGEQPTLLLPKPPLVSVSSVQYYDVDGALQTFPAASYWVVPGKYEPRLVLKPTATWPELEDSRPAAILVDFVAGYGGASAVPAHYVAGLQLVLTHLYENRSEEVTGTIVARLGLGSDTLWGRERVYPV